MARTIKYQAKQAAAAGQGDIKKKKSVLFIKNLSSRLTSSKRRGKSCFEMSETAIWLAGTGYVLTLAVFVAGNNCHCGCPTRQY